MPEDQELKVVKAVANLLKAVGGSTFSPPLRLAFGEPNDRTMFISTAGLYENDQDAKFVVRAIEQKQLIIDSPRPALGVVIGHSDPR